jgi:flagellar biosynthetic protein FliR
MISLRINSLEVATCLAIFLRLGLAVFLVPPFSNTRVPPKLKACVVVTLAALLYPVLKSVVSPLSLQPADILCTVLGELIFSMLLAISVGLILAAFDFAGELISYQTGLAFAQVVDPQGGVQTSIFSNLVHISAMVLFLGINGHHVILRTIVDSFHSIPIGGFVLQAQNVSRLIVFAGQLFVISVKIAAPLLAVLLLTQVGLGVIAKFVPNINILITSFPITISIGLFFTGLSFPIWGGAMKQYFHGLFQFLHTLLQVAQTY